MQESKVNILGTEYEILIRKESEDSKLEKCDGYVDNTAKQIVVGDFEPDEMSVENLQAYQKKVCRHEIIHAFLMESGLDDNASIPSDGWARNEEMVDWFAIQSPKIFKIFTDLKLL